MNKANWFWLSLISSILLCSGCVERALVIRSEPVGAKVFIDGIDAGTTPVRVPFDFYGTRDVLVRMEEDEKRGERSLSPIRRIVKLTPPWYQRFPLDFISENLWPGKLTVIHEEVFVMEPQDLDALSERFRDTARGFGVASPLDDPEDSP
ncbi:MAG: PEGA domain-containing protein [Planctomycetota bacterium]|nr:PEGA domain-containing protein [Planctomycetota bacterium]